MKRQIKVLIGIQARSTSKRFPGKVFEKLGNKMLLQHVIDNCLNPARHMNNVRDKSGISAEVALLIPKGDEIKARFKDCNIYEGSEDDVLERYYNAAMASGSDYVVRVTGDCPLIPPPIITKCINSCVRNKLDYVSNVIVKVYPDGFDCETFTFDALEKAHLTTKDKYDREHVTPWIHRQNFKFGHLIPFSLADLNQKFSVDTEEDLLRVKESWHKIDDAVDLATRRDGRVSIFRF